jgi:demethylphylloquinone reductase
MSDLIKRIVILGGGFGGLYTGLRLNELPWQNDTKTEIILVDQGDRFLFSPLLYELVTSELQSWEIAPPFSELLANSQVQFLQDKVTGIDVSKGIVKLASHAPLNYDKLVISMGSKTSKKVIKGGQEFALTFRSLNDAYLLREKLRKLENSGQEKIRVAIIGAGYSGVEIACKLADRLGEKGRIRIIEKGTEILKHSPKFNQETARKALESKKVWLDFETEVGQVTKDSISLVYKGEEDTIPVDLVIITVGNQVSELITDLPLTNNAKNQLQINEKLQVLDNHNIYAIGDVAESKDENGKTLPPTAQTAIQQADYCAWNIWASLNNRPLLPFKYQPLGEMMVLGKDNATLTGLGLQMEGLPGYLTRRLVYLYRLPTWEHKLKVALNWIINN